MEFNNDFSDMLFALNDANVDDLVVGASRLSRVLLSTSFTLP